MNVRAYEKGFGPQIDTEFANVLDTYVQGSIDTFRTNLTGADIRNDEHPYPIWIRDSDLRSVVHCTTGEVPYDIQNTQAANGTIIHGANLDDVILKEFATIDKTNAKDSHLGTLTYILSDEDLFETELKDGQLIIKQGDFYLESNLNPSQAREMADKRKSLRNQYIRVLENGGNISAEDGFVHPYSMFVNSATDRRNFIAQRATVMNSGIDTGTNVQEGCIVDCVDTGEYNIFAHNAMARNVQAGDYNFFMFNALAEHAEMGDNVILLPNTSIEGNARSTIELESGLYFGHITNQKKADNNRITFEELKRTTPGNEFYKGLMQRMEHILELNGGFPHKYGHAQNHNQLKYKEI